jgi:hypothetical protein
VLKSAKAAVIDDDTAASMAKHQEERSSGYSDLRNKRPMPAENTTLSRLGRLLRIGASCFVVVLPLKTNHLSRQARDKDKKMNTYPKLCLQAARRTPGCSRCALGR